MELHYIYENHRNIKKIIKFFLIIAILLTIMIVFFDSYINKKTICENIKFDIALGTMISLFLGIISCIMAYIVNNIMMKYHKNIIKNGEKVQAVVFNTNFRIPVGSIIPINSLLLEINHSIYTLEYLENNKAFKDLTKYFETQKGVNYKDNQRLTINAYLYKNKIYADLDSLNLNLSQNKIRNEE